MKAVEHNNPEALEEALLKVALAQNADEVREYLLAQNP